MPGDDVGLQQADPLASALAEMDARVAALEKTGQFWPGMIGWTGSSVAPVGWLIADGSAFDVDRYAALAVIFPTGFLPNLINSFAIGAGGLYPLLSVGGAASVTLTGAQSGVPAHTHGITGPSGGPSVANTGNDNVDHTHTVQMPASVGSGSTPNAINAGNFTSSQTTSGRSTVHQHSMQSHTHTLPAATDASVAANAASSHSVLNPYVALTPLVHV